MYFSFVRALFWLLFLIGKCIIFAQISSNQTTEKLNDWRTERMEKWRDTMYTSFRYSYDPRFEPTRDEPCRLFNHHLHGEIKLERRKVLAF
jgi:hypothetical protein